MEIRQALAQRSKEISIGLGIALPILAGLFETQSGTPFSLELFYLLPVVLTAWNAGAKAGVGVAILSTLVSFAAEVNGDLPLLQTYPPYWNAFSKLAVYLFIVWMIPAVQEELERQRQSSQTDFLTRVANKRGFLAVAQKELERSSRYRHPFTIASLDIDHLRFINERMGHSTGDLLLQEVAHAIQERIRVTDLIARMGSDDFTLLLPETQSEPAQIVMRRLQKHLLDVAEKNEWPVSFSIGVATFLKPPASVEEMLRRSEVLLFAAKKAGKNCVQHEVVQAAEKAS